MIAKKARVYSTPTCPWCYKTKDFLKENNIEFEDINVASDQKAAREMFEKTGQMGVPVTEIGSELIVGFDKSRLKKALGIA